MKYFFQLLLFFAMTPAAAVDSATDQDLVQIKALCVKNAKPEAKKMAPIDAVCECSVKRTLERLRTEENEEKDPQGRIAWFKKMYDLKLTKKEIDADEYGIFDFNISVTETCLNELKELKEKKSSNKPSKK